MLFRSSFSENTSELWSVSSGTVLGIYAYRRSFLLKYAALQPTPLERAESLEQLRALENGYKIKVLESDFQGIGVDTPEDLAAVNELFAKMNK